MSGSARTGGGRFDPAEGFAYFVAADPQRLSEIAERHSHVLIALNDLFREGRNVYLDRALAVDGNKTLLDSGIFWLATQHAAAHGLTMDDALKLAPDTLDGWDKLTTAYIDRAREHEDELWGYVELDQGGAEWKRKTRAWLESEGVRPIPVYHPLTDGWDYLDELLDAGYDRLMVGNVVYASQAVRTRIMLTVWERVRRLPRERRPWLHLLGVTPFGAFAACPFSSCDTSGFVQAFHWGGSIGLGASAMGRFSSLDGYMYDSAQSQQADTGAIGLSRTIGLIAGYEEQAWRQHRADLEVAFGVVTPYPDLVPPEPEPVPEAA